MLIEDEDKQLHRCVEVFLQWSFALNSEKESFFSTTADTVLPSFDDGETYQEVAVKSCLLISKDFPTGSPKKKGRN